MAYLRVRGEGGTLFPKDRCVVSFDGTHIAYTIKGNTGPVVALCAGFCCPDNFWRYLAPSLARKYRVLIWNYRGMGSSGMPREPGYRARNYNVEDFTVDRYAKDLKAILDHEQIDETVILGHSMGTQVALEAYRMMPERISALVSITGPFASAINSLYNTTIAPRLFPAGLILAKTVARPLWRALFKMPFTHPLAIQFGALGPKTKMEDMKPYYEHLAELDLQMILKAAEAMHAHSAEDILRKVKVPTLVIVGERDNFVPPWVGHVMTSRIPVAEMLIVPGGTHGTIVEEPKMVNKAVHDFLDRYLGEGQPKVTVMQQRNRTTRSKRVRSSAEAEQ
jgi:pimeloyl-ACP methyl ester carboxylesterase